MSGPGYILSVTLFSTAWNLPRFVWSLYDDDDDDDDENYNGDNYNDDDDDENNNDDEDNKGEGDDVIVFFLNCMKPTQVLWALHLH